MKNKQRQQGPTVTRSAESAIEPNKFYRLCDAQNLMGVGATAFRNMRDDGLVVHYLGRQGWVSGSDLIDHITAKSKKSR